MTVAAKPDRGGGVSPKTQKRPTLARRGAKGSEGRTNPAKGQKDGTSGHVGGDRLHVESWPIVRVKPYARNPRKNAPAVQKVAASIQAFGFRQPIVVDPKGTILVGHTRLLAALHLGLKEVPVHVAHGLTEAQAKAYRLADNRTAEEAEWDTDLLAQEFGDLQALDFDLSLTGFEPSEIAGAQHSGLAPGVDPDAVPDLPKQPVSREGDLIQLGAHRLLCGDATRADHWERLMAGERADLFWTDPPYGVGYEAKNEHLKAWDGRLERPSHASSVSNDTLTSDALRELLAGSFALGWANLVEGGPWYVAAPAGPLHLTFAQVLLDLRVFRQTLAWIKDSFVIGRSDYHYRHEPIFYGWKEGAAHYFVDDRTQDTVWEIPRPKASKEHPTMKPAELVARAIRNSSKPGDLVVDPFAGSGTTLIAAEQEGRRAYLMEIDPRYADVIVSRWENATGQSAVRPKVAA